MAITWLAASMLGSLAARSLGWFVGANWIWWLGGALGWGLAALGRRGWPAAWLAAMCWGVVLAPRPEPDDQAPSGGLARLTFEVERGGCGQRGCFAEAQAVGCHEVERSACVRPGTRVGVASSSELPAGARITALAKLRPRVRFVNPGEVTVWPDTRALYTAKLQDAAHPRVDHVPWLASGIAALRVRIRELLARTLQPPHDGIARALLLGEGSAVDPELNEAIRDAGVSHVLAVSGMHVTLLVGAWVIAVRRLWLFTPGALVWEARRVGAAVGVVLAPLLSRLCGASPSAERAAWTSMLMYLLTALGLRPSPLPVAALVVAGFAVIEPREGLHPGFLLSVLATAALLSDAPIEHKGKLAWVRTAFRTSTRAWLATTPFLLLCFGQLALVPLLANVLLLPLGEALVPLAAVHLVNASVDLLPTRTLFSLASGAFVEGARWCASLDPGLMLPPPTATQTVALAVLAMSFLVRCSWRARGVVGAAVLLAMAGAEWSLRLPADTLRVTFLDVGQGDAALLESDGHTMLIDAGGAIGPGPDPGALAVLPALRARRVDALDHVVLTHPHPDHYGGLPAVLAAVPVRELWDNGQGPAEDVQPVVALLNDARARGTRMRTPSELCGPHTFGRAKIEVLAPCPAFDFTREPNDNSFVLRVTHGAHTFLLMGDSEREAEESLASVGRADVLKLGHHGSRTSSTPAFLAQVQPTLAIASAGRGNTFGHPHPEIIQRLGSRLLRTDREGGIELESDGRTLRVRSARQPAWRAVSAGPSS